jgi:hypothetical protein
VWSTQTVITAPTCRQVEPDQTVTPAEHTNQVEQIRPTKWARSDCQGHTRNRFPSPASRTKAIGAAVPPSAPLERRRTTRTLAAAPIRAQVLCPSVRRGPFTLVSALPVFDRAPLSGGGRGWMPGCRRGRRGEPPIKARLTSRLIHPCPPECGLRRFLFVTSGSAPPGCSCTSLRGSLKTSVHRGTRGTNPSASAALTRNNGHLHDYKQICGRLRTWVCGVPSKESSGAVGPAQGLIRGLSHSPSGAFAEDRNKLVTC